MSTFRICRNESTLNSDKKADVSQSKQHRYLLPDEKDTGYFQFITGFRFSRPGFPLYPEK